MKHTHIFFSLSLISMLALASCDRSAPFEHAAPGGSSVKITSTTPNTSVPLRVGDTVKLRVEVAYQLDADSGTLNLVVQAADNSGLAQDTEVVTRGSGNTKFKAQFVVPDTKAIQVFTPLSAKSQTSTSTVDMWAFKVVPK